MAIFQKIGLWRRSLCSKLGGIDPEKLYRATLRTLENVYKDMEIKYRSVKIQQETITDRLIETGSKEELLKANQQVRDKVRGDFLKYREIFATYQKACNSQKLLDKHDALKHLRAMTTVVTKVADVLGLQKNG